MIAKCFLVEARGAGEAAPTSVWVALTRQALPGPFMGEMAARLAAPLTVYLLPHGDAFIMRCFAGRDEVEPAWAALPAAAKAVWANGLRPAGPLLFHTRNGVLTVAADDPDSVLILRADSLLRPPEATPPPVV